MGARVGVDKEADDDRILVRALANQALRMRQVQPRLKRVAAEAALDPRRSKLFHWLSKNHKRLAPSLSKSRVDWAPLISAATRAGVADGMGQQPTERTIRGPWRKVCEAVSSEQAAACAQPFTEALVGNGGHATIAKIFRDELRLLQDQAFRRTSDVYRLILRHFSDYTSLGVGTPVGPSWQFFPDHLGRMGLSNKKGADQPRLCSANLRTGSTRCRESAGHTRADRAAERPP